MSPIFPSGHFNVHLESTVISHAPCCSCNHRSQGHGGPCCPGAVVGSSACPNPTAQSSILPIRENFVAETWDTPSENAPISFSHSVPSPAQSHCTSAPQLTAEQPPQLPALGDDLEQLWDHPRSPATLKKRILRTVLQVVVASTTDDPPSVHLKLLGWGFTHRAHRAQEPDRLSQPHQLPRSNRGDS